MSMKSDVRRLLTDNDFEGLSDLLDRDRRVVPALNRLLFDDDELICWRAVTGLGLVARKDPDLLEKVISRLFWTMNDDSGSVGWFTPQALGEICVNDPDLVEDFFPIIITNIGHKVFRQGAIWAVGRVAPFRPDLVEEAGDLLVSFLIDPDPNLRGLACWSLGRMNWIEAKRGLGLLVDDRETSTIYEDGHLRTRTVGEVARTALESMPDP